MQVLKVRNSTTTSGPVEMEITLRITTHDIHYYPETGTNEIVAAAALCKLINDSWDVVHK